MNKLKSTSAYKAFRKFGKNLRKTIKRFFFKRKLNKATPVFVYQMGKVASSSIFASLTKQYPGPVGHAHHIGSDNWMSELLYDWAKSGKPLKIISPVREPIGKNISSFFQVFDRIAGIPYCESKYSVDELKDIFIEKYNHDGPLEWFDRNIKKHFDIDVYENKFPDSHVAQYSCNNVSLLIIRIDVDDTIKEKVISDFLDFPGFQLKNRNLSETKDYNNDYKTLKKELKLPESYLTKMTQSKYFKHFYSDIEIEKITSKYK